MTRKRLNRKRKQKEKQEFTRLGAALRKLGGLGGGAIGSLIGNPTGGAGLGTDIGASISKWLGSGDYRVGKNTILQASMSGNSIPAMHKTGQSIIIRHKEFVADILAGTGTPTGFNVFNSYALNPGLSTSFPWLSTVAQNFQEYTWKGVVFHYVPTSGASVASTNTALGSVMMATNYRATAPAYTDKQLLLNEYFSSDARPTDYFHHPIECDPKENPYNVQYVRTGEVPSGEDQKTYDLGVTYVATQGMPAAGNNVGELWVTYEVELRKPKSVGQLQLDSGYFYTTRTDIANTTAPLGATDGTSVGDIVSSITGTTITFRRGLIGKYVVLVTYLAASLTAVNGTFSYVYTDCSEVEATQLNASITPTGSFMNYYLCIEIPDSQKQAILLNTANFFTGTTDEVAVRIFEVNSAFG